MKKILFLITFTLLQFVLLAQPKYEFSAFWVATAFNIDWPSKPGLSTEQQKAEAIAILEMHRELNMNAVIFQVRPAADAFYPSDIEPWSQFLTGTPGKVPDPFYDPLQFWIEESHKRGMEFHAWFNPFRGIRDVDNIALSENHIFHRHPDWFVRYGAHMYFDPGRPLVKIGRANV